MSITMRQGLETDFEAENLVSGELAITTDTGNLYYRAGNEVHRAVKAEEYEEDMETKVDKVTGKGLSTNDYSTTEKNKLADIEAQANKTVVDNALSDSSENPLQNKVIKTALDNKMDADNDHLADLAVDSWENTGNEYMPVHFDSTGKPKACSNFHHQLSTGSKVRFLGATRYSALLFAYAGNTSSNIGVWFLSCGSSSGNNNISPLKESTVISIEGISGENGFEVTVSNQFSTRIEFRTIYGAWTSQTV